MFGYLYSDVETFAVQTGRYTIPPDEDQLLRLPPVPIWAWDENVEWQNSRGLWLPEFTPENEWPTKLPSANVPVVALGWDNIQEVSQAREYQLFNYDYEDFWNPVLISTINFFDDFEPDYSNVSVQQFRSSFFAFEDEGPLIFPVPIQIGFLNSQFDDWDWNQNFSSYAGTANLESETGFPPVFSFFVVLDEDFQGAKWAALVYVPQDLSFEDFSLVANFPPPAAPTTDFTDEVAWQHNLEVRFGQESQESDVVLNPTAPGFIPTLAWDEVDWSKLFPVVVGGIQILDSEDQTYGWFLFVPPPIILNCPLPPTGADKDVIMSTFGGASPTLALFCRVCNSGKPLVVRADYAIWCQDCCAFVSKQDTYMGTVQAPGQFRSIF